MVVPILETERLILRQIRNEDAVDIFNYLSQDEVTKLYDIDSLTEIKQAERLVAYWDDMYKHLTGIRWGITLKGENRIIGTCGFHRWAKKHDKAEIGYELSPTFWNQGYMTEALKAVIQFGFNELQLNRIEALIHHENVKSKKTLERSGFKAEGRLEQYLQLKQAYIDVIIFSLLKHNWRRA